MDRHNIESIYPVLPAQEAFLWTKTESADVAGSLQMSCTLRGNLDVEKFQQAWNATVTRHELLRASIHARADREPMLVVWRKVS